MQVIDAVCYALAVWRVSSVITRGQGPFQVFAHVRAWADPEGVQKPGSLGELTTCLWCMSIWSAAILWFCPIIVWYVFSASAAAMAMDRHLPDEGESQ